MTQTIIIEILDDGTRIYYNENKERHREDGPAVERADGSKEWWLNGKRHREDGPAIEHPDGTKYWYWHGVLYSEQLHKEKTKKLPPPEEHHCKCCARALLKQIE